MKILNFTEFTALPPGVLFSYYEPAICTGLFRKGESLMGEFPEEGHRDFYEASIVAQCLNGEHPTVDDIECRNGSYDYDQLFAVYEPADIAVIRSMLP